MMADVYTHDQEKPIAVFEFPPLETEHEWNSMLRRPACFAAVNLRKKRVEVNVRRATDQEKKLIEAAKALEVKEFIAERCVELLRDKELEGILPGDIMKMRFVVTWKADPQSVNGKRAKARLVVLGFQDPNLGKELTLAPTMAKRSRTMFLQSAVQRQWKVWKADVKAAFLQGREFDTEDTRYALPPKELAMALGMDPSDPRPVRLRKSVYGLTRAPLDWYLRVAEMIGALLGVTQKTDPCVWIFYQRYAKGRSVYESTFVV